MPSRRSHQNSHHGCLSCKARKVKCGEERPQCQRCKKQGRQCEYASFAPANSWPTPPTAAYDQPLPSSAPSFTVPPASKAPAVPAPASASSLSPGSLASPPGASSPGMKISNILNSSPTSPSPHQGLSEASRQDLKLMHHWTLYAYETLVDRSNMTTVWQKVVPAMAVDHSFLMHGLLSITAFHLAYLSPDQRPFHVDLALHHHAQAITLVRPALENISRQNCNALFAFTTVAAVVAFAKPFVLKLPTSPSASSPPPTAFPDPLDEMMELIFLLRGISAVVQSSYAWIATGPLQPMLRAHEPSTWVDLTPELDIALRTLSERNASSDLSTETKASCADAIEKLRRYFRDPEIAQGEKGKLVAWPIMCDKDYILALSAREPMALAISAYWGAMVQDLETWWAESWGNQVIGAVVSCLDENWEPCLSWAKEKVRFTG